jgi:hypothetical protein
VSLPDFKKVILGLDVVVQCSIMDRTLFPRAGTTPTNNLKYRMEEVPMKLNDSISTYDVAEALQGETGKFEVRSNRPQRRTLFRYVPTRTLHCQFRVGGF